jgi:hypothetical protein
VDAEQARARARAHAPSQYGESYMDSAGNGGQAAGWRGMD